jgi:hypothetical protein
MGYVGARGKITVQKPEIVFWDVARIKWLAPTTPVGFWTVLRIYCHVLSWASQLKLLAFALCFCAPRAVVPAGQYNLVEVNWCSLPPSSGLDCAAQHRRSQPSSYSLPWEPDISRVHKPVAVALRCSSNTGIVGSNPTWGKNVVSFLSFCCATLSV